ncbi:MAG: Sec-independent protein translocase protein TatA [Acidimicrobiales bacterium]|nr:Sec-independent protein translocase protein TatA [Acidimicrobiales bacterium]
MGLGAPELLIILVVVMVLFGGKKLPELARSLGQAKNEFEEATTDKAKPAAAAPTVTPAPASAPAPAVVPATEPAAVNGHPTSA